MPSAPDTDRSQQPRSAADSDPRSEATTRPQTAAPRPRSASAPHQATTAAPGPQPATARSAHAAEPAPLPPGTYVVVPAYNESAKLDRVLRRLRSAQVDVVVVDDGSQDETAEVARAYTPYVLRHVINRGQGAALQTGITFALRRGARTIVTFDADGQHRVEDLAALIAPIAGGQCDIALGSRFLSGPVRMPRLRRLTLRLGVVFTRIVNRMPLTDTHNGLRAFSRRAAERIRIDNDRMAHASELIDRIRETGLPYREVPVSVRYTKYSVTKGQALTGSFRILLDYFVGRVTR